MQPHILILSDRRFTTIILTATVLFLFSDQNLLAPNLSLIAEEFHFDAEQRDDKLGTIISIHLFYFFHID